eukprot:TRINITY_DN41580_c0_g1_i1.p1 TRINITY_DN41580_c0_g1~~TRINITY_DN41580_c0_g1_i1.p1  ORF type:complete len:232 (+),score=61.49 TRINITY_DN41580_c0_g1_i1:45-698(+)
MAAWMRTMFILLLSAVTAWAEVLRKGRTGHPRSHHRHHVQAPADVAAKPESLDDIVQEIAQAAKNKNHLIQLQKTVKSEVSLLRNAQSLMKASQDEETISESRSEVEQAKLMLIHGDKMVKKSWRQAEHQIRNAVTSVQLLEQKAEQEVLAEDETIRKATAARKAAQADVARAKELRIQAEEQASYYDSVNEATKEQKTEVVQQDMRTPAPEREESQ